MSKQAIEREAWDSHKDLIIRMYRDENKSLEQVMTFMRQNHRFIRTKAQYEGAFRRWEIKKNSKSNEWSSIARHFYERKAQGRDIAVTIRGVRVPDRRLRKEVARYGYQFSMERFTTDLTIRQRSKTPPDIQIFTPPGPLSPFAMGSYENPEVSVKWNNEQFLVIAEQTIWHQFIQFIKSPNINLQKEIFHLPNDPVETYEAVSPQIRSLQPTFEVHRKPDQKIISLAIIGWLDNILCANYMTDMVCWHLPDALINPGPYLPPNRDGTSDINMNAITDFHSKSTQLEFLKQAAYLISNNFETVRITSALVDLLHNQKNMNTLQNLIDLGMPLVDVLLEKLWIPAMRAENRRLMTIILESGVHGNIDMEERYFCAAASTFQTRTALHLAIEMQDVESVTFLLSHDANAILRNVATERDQAYCTFDTLLDLAVDRADTKIIEKLLEYTSNDITYYTICLAILRDNDNVFELLLENNPSVKHAMYARPWLLLEAAASRGSIEGFLSVMSHKLDIWKTDEAGKGSALAAAAASNNIAFIRHVFSMGAKINSVAVGFGHWQWINHFVRSDTLAPIIDDMAALHIAIRGSNTEAVEFLISVGADVNQSCPIGFPIQLAAYVGNESIVDMLLKAGADVNAIARCAPWDGFDNRLPLEEIAHKPAIRLALERGHSTIFEQLIRAHADLTTPTAGSRACQAEEWDPMTSALQSGVSYLIEKIFLEFPTTIKSDFGTLADLIIYGYDHRAKQLVKCGSVNPENLYHPVVLCAAVSSGDKEFVQSLLSGSKARHGCLSSNYGATGFAAAIALGQYDMISLFLDAGITPYEHVIGGNYPVVQPSVELFTESVMEMNENEWVFVSNNDDTPILHAVVRFRNTLGRSEIPLARLKILIDACEKPQEKAQQLANWRTALYFTCIETIRLGSYEATVMIISKGIDINWHPSDHPSLLQTAIEEQYRDLNSCIPTHLLDLGANPNRPESTCALADADVNAKPEWERAATALQFAAMNGNFEMLILLLKNGAYINEPPGMYDGRTAIEGAAELGRFSMVSYLLEAGADIRGRNNTNYRRTIFRAWEHQHHALANFIQKWKAEKYGPGDCDSIPNIMHSMTFDELYFSSPEAKSQIPIYNWEYDERVFNRRVRKRQFLR